jgi:hypothetical protein
VRLPGLAIRNFEWRRCFRAWRGGSAPGTDANTFVGSTRGLFNNQLNIPPVLARLGGGAAVPRSHNFLPVHREKGFAFDFKMAKPGLNAETDDACSLVANAPCSGIQSGDYLVWQANWNGARNCHFNQRVYGLKKNATFFIFPLDIVYLRYTISRVKTKCPRTRPIPIRLTAFTTNRLDAAARRLSSNRAAVIRLAIHQLLPDIEAGRWES